MAVVEEPPRFLVRFIHVEKMLPPLPGVHDLLLADLLKMPPEVLTGIRAQLAAEVRTAAESLLADEAFAKQVDALPFAAGSTVVGLGDSLTDDLQSWLEILRQVLQLRRPKDGIKLVNAGSSGEATPQILFRVPGVVALDPQWIICMAGTNDARRFGGATSPTQVSLGETSRNLAAFADYASRHGKARWMWMTPPPVIESRVDGHWFWTPMATSWNARDVKAVGDAMQSLGEPVVDLRPLFAGAAGADLILDDGVHPALEGQKAILRALVAKLAGQ
jgi:lysophospholipase L1-like esterase